MKFKTSFYLNFLFVGLATFFMGDSWAQEFEFETNWIENKNICTPCGYNEDNGEVSTTITKQIKLRGDYDFSFEILSIAYQEIDLPSFYSAAILPNEPNVKIAFSTTRGENFITALYNPILKRNGKIEIVSKITVSIVGIPSLSSQNRDFDFAPNSVLATGDWYKIGVKSDGVYKLSYNDLAELGIAVGELNPKSINIYGNHTPELSHDNSEYRPDDLVKNSIFVRGEADLSFNTDDYILFYAKGPENLTINTSFFNPEKNKIDSLAYYFIHIDNSDFPKRISTVNSTDNPFTHSISTYNGYSLHENNQVNLLKSGEGWYGEYFEGSQLAYSFTIPIENRDITQPIVLDIGYVSAVRTGSGGLKVIINGVEIVDFNSLNLSGEYTVARAQDSTMTFDSGTESLNVELEFHRTSPASEAWLDYLKFNYIKKMRMGIAPLIVRDLRSVGLGNVVKYNVSNATSNTQVWEVTDHYNTTQVNGVLTAENYTFVMDADSLRTFVAFTNSQVKKVVLSGGFLGKIKNQNLHGLPQADYLIVTHFLLRSQADRLANLHRANGLTVHVVDIQNIYNEFSGGVSDPVAIRWFTKMFYERAAIDPSNTLKYLCLFGDGTYDPLNRIPKNNYLLPTYNNPEIGSTVHYTKSFSSDDFFGLLDDDEKMYSTDMLDIGIGRIPVSDISVAEQVVNKIEHYMNDGSSLYANVNGVQCNSDGYSSTFGDWRNRVVLMADDEDYGRFVQDCEAAYDTIFKYNPEMNVVKIYLDAYKQTVTSGGQRYPDVEEAINQNMNNGALVFNYVGHGGETGLSLERVVSIPMIKAWANINNMPIFISATCEFSRFDDPGRVSAGETTLTTPYGGAVGLLTTTRLVNTVVNARLIKNLYTVIFNEEDGEALTLGEITRRTKNKTLGHNHMRHFGLLGDPALRIGKPKPRIVTDSINGVSVDVVTDTLKALSIITIKGHIENESGDLLNDYNGIIYSSVFDKNKKQQTLGQDIESPVLTFHLQKSILYKGKSTVKNGAFSFSFVVPKDINYSFGKGKISYYGKNGTFDNYGLDTTIVVGGINPDGISDDLGPEISLFMNDNLFVNGGLTNTKPMFLANVSDISGVNTVGNGIGHNITLILDDNTASTIVLNNFYEADLDTYQSGKIAFQMSELKEGPHQIVFKVWDVNNNSSEAVLDFIVVKEEEIGISHLLNYPNPFTTNTDFYFEHNQVCNTIDVKVEIFTVSGKLVKTIIKTIHSSGFRSEGINWNGRDEYGDRLARGVYVYRLSIETEQGVKAEKIEKLVLL